MNAAKRNGSSAAAGAEDEQQDQQRRPGRRGRARPTRARCASAGPMSCWTAGLPVTTHARPEPRAAARRCAPRPRSGSRRRVDEGGGVSRRAAARCRRAGPPGRSARRAGGRGARARAGGGPGRSGRTRRPRRRCRSRGRRSALTWLEAVPGSEKPELSSGERWSAPTAPARPPRARPPTTRRRWRRQRSHSATSARRGRAAGVLAGTRKRLEAEGAAAMGGAMGLHRGGTAHPKRAW